MGVVEDEIDHAFELASMDSEVFRLDEGYSPIAISRQLPPFYRGAELTYEPSILTGPLPSTTVAVRGEIAGDDRRQTIERLRQRDGVVGVYADPGIVGFETCLTDPAVGTANDVHMLMDASDLIASGMTGSGVTVAIVDGGFNRAYLQALGLPVELGPPDQHLVPQGVFDGPGEHPPDHGTMCTFDVSILAPDATFLDHAVLRTQAVGRNIIERLASDALRSYAVLHGVLDQQTEQDRRMVVSNSWGIASQEDDFPPSDPGNFSNHPTHLLNVAIQGLALNGADVIFAAGNCGPGCPHVQCDFGPLPPICGAASLQAVTCVAAVDIHRGRLCYSSVGPGRLDPEKPDLSAYAHFDGSGVSGLPDGGTSAACPVYAGLIAAVRTRYSQADLAPAQLRALVQKTCADLGGRGYDHEYGSGVPDVAALLHALP